MKHIAYLLLCLFFASTLVSCHSSKKNVRERDDIYYDSKAPEKPKRPVEKNDRYFGFKIGKNDNRRLYEELSRWYGAPYRYGGESPSGTDCSGMVMMVYKRVYGKRLERNSAKIYSKNCRKISRGELREGDLVFFNTSKKGKGINHVGIYLKDHKFIHASSSRGVIVSNLDDDYYRRTFIAAGRVK